MAEILRAVAGQIPLEREFEGWISRCIEDYFETLGLSTSVIAVSPSDESTWPADEAFQVHGKLIGLQMKRPHVSGNPPPADPGFERLHWLLEAAQFQLIKNRPEIFYCLPTFVNRAWRRDALHHCIFWQPTRRAKPDTLWYQRKFKNNPHDNLDRYPSAFRWGQLYERINACKVGIPSADLLPSVPDYIRALLTELGSADANAEEVAPDAAGPTDADVLILIDVPMPPTV